MIFLVSVTLAATSLSCSKNAERAVSVIGSTSMQPFAAMLVQEFNKQHPGASVEVQGGGSMTQALR